MRLPVCLLLAILTLTACSRSPAPPPDADLIVVGAGIAGLSAALEASDAGARVIVVEASSLGGGHAVKAGGFALVGTPLQEARGYRDSPDIAFQDLMAWGEDADAGWVRRYVEDSRREVHDWLEAMGVRFTFILDTPQHSVPRFHFAGGSARKVVVAMMWVASAQSRISFRWNTEVTRLVREGDRITGVETRNLRTGETGLLRAPAVVVATGGFQSNLDLVRANWREGRPRPDRLFIGAGQFATGSGIALGRDAGAALVRMDHQTTFTAGLPEPRFPGSGRALLTQNPSAIWVNAAGLRFVNESGPSKISDAAALAQAPATYWLITDARGSARTRVRDAVWLRDPDSRDHLARSPHMVTAPTVAALAKAAGLPPDALEKTVARWNAAVAAGTDTDFGRFSPEKPDPAAAALTTPPFHAIQVFPLTRKSLGGLAVNENTQVLDATGTPIPGLYAAGEVTGVAGINGSYGGEGTFLGPSVYMGRISGREAVRSLGRAIPGGSAREPWPEPVPVSPPDPGSRARAVTLAPGFLDALLALERPGWWHFGEVHRTVRDRKQDCLQCHSPAWPTKPAETREEWRAQLLSCEDCHQ
jgi:flavocytochrome c